MAHCSNEEPSQLIQQESQLPYQTSHSTEEMAGHVSQQQQLSAHPSQQTAGHSTQHTQVQSPHTSSPAQQHVFSTNKGPMKVCIKRPDGSMVEQTHLSVSHTKDGKFVINSNGHPQAGQWIQGNGAPIRAILIDNNRRQVPTTVQMTPPAPPPVAPIRHQSDPPSVRPCNYVPKIAPKMQGTSGQLQARAQPRHPVNLPPRPSPSSMCRSNSYPASIRNTDGVVGGQYHQNSTARQIYNAQQASLHNGNPEVKQEQEYKVRGAPAPSAAYKTPQTQVLDEGTPSRWSNNSVLNGINTMSNGVSVMAGNRKRASPTQFDVKPTPTTDRKRPRRSSERGGKGLRHFSSKVCEKVKSKGVTTYLEVSEELVEEFSHQNILLSTPSSANSFDVKNIRRRVYDALNVLCAMNIISKDKKEIRWIGLPTNSLQECRQLELQKQELEERIREKKKRAQEYMLQLIAYKTLIQRNRDMEERTGTLPENATIQVPFIILSTGPNTQISLEVADDKTEYEFSFNDLFEIHDEIGILKKMGFCYGLDSGTFTPEGLATAEGLLPKSAKPFLRALFPRNSDGSFDDTKPLDITENPPQISVKVEPPVPQELSDVQKQAFETYSFDAPTYSSNFPAYNGHQSNASTSSAASTLTSVPSHSTHGASHDSLASDTSRDAANTLLSLTAAAQ